MKTFLAELLLISMPALLAAQITVPATTPPHEPITATVTVPSTGDSQVLWEYGPTVNAIQQETTKLYIWAPPGQHTLGATVISINWDAKRFNVLRHAATFTVTGAPTPIPPGPVIPPVVPPGPVIPPVPGAKLTAIIIHETEDDSPAFSQRLVLLRTGDAAKYLRDKGHRLLVVDDDSTDENGRPSQLVGKIKALGVPLPFVALLGEDGAVVKTMPLTDATTATDVLDVIKQAGG